MRRSSSFAQSHRRDHSAASKRERIAAAVRSGDLAQARRLLESELRRQPGETTLRYRLALIREATGDRDGAAADFTRVLRHVPDHGNAARRLGAILAQGRLGGDATLDPLGLAACLSHTVVDRDLVAAAALDQMSRSGPLSRALKEAAESGSDAAAGSILSQRSHPLLRDELLLAVLGKATVARPDVEALLTALRRRIALVFPPDQVLERDLPTFAAALALQCWSNEYVFAETAEERCLRDAPMPPLASLLAGEREATVRYMRQALYENPVRWFPDGIRIESLSRIRPAPFASSLVEIVEEERTIAANASRFATAMRITDQTSLKVKAQYESHPYPRWRGVALFPQGEYTAHLENFFSKDEIDFTHRDFEVLVAGCGTGCQAVSAALDYGPKAHVTGIDISARSLGYARTMAERMGVENLDLALGDIMALDAAGTPTRGRFQVIECCGVLHHMADPWAAWAGLLSSLAPGGIMLIGLYSAIARRDLEALRADPGFPGAGCSDDALRDWRRSLYARGPEAPGTRYLASRDAFTASGFRDFFLHTSERVVTLAEIEAFLSRHRLAFRGFANLPFSLLSERYPGEQWPGRLGRWAELEAERPSLFLGMYQLWVTRI